MAKSGPKVRPITLVQILAWADAWYTEKGDWPGTYSGPIPGAGLTWRAVNEALNAGSRDYRGMSCEALNRLLEQMAENVTREMDSAEAYKRELRARALGISVDDPVLDDIAEPAALADGTLDGYLLQFQVDDHWIPLRLFADKNDAIAAAGAVNEKYSVSIMEIRPGMVRQLPEHWEVVQTGQGIEFVFVDDDAW
jgi:hypothetical protein